MRADLSVLILFGVMLTACHTPHNTRKVPDEKLSGTLRTLETSVAKSGDDLNDISGGIKEADNSIIRHTDTIIKDDTRGLHVDETTGIQDEVGKLEEHRLAINGIADDLHHANTMLKDSQRDVETLRVAIKQLQEQLDMRDAKIDKLQSSLSKTVQHVMLWMLIGGFVMIGACVMLIMNGKPGAIGVGMAGIVIIVVSLAVSYFMAHLAFIGVIGAIVALAFMAYKVREQYLDKKARFETVKSLEHIKETYVMGSARAKEFGGKVDDGIVGTMQSPTTKNRIREDRKRLLDDIAPTVLRS